jgi:hypothetical protein
MPLGTTVGLVLVLNACPSIGYILYATYLEGAYGGAVVEALRYKAEDRGIDS